VIELIRKKFLALNYQIALVDFEDPNSYPQWITGEENAVLGPKGIAVATPSDGDIETIVLWGEGGIIGTELISGIISVGKKGLFVGNEISASYTIISWPTGESYIKGFINIPTGDDIPQVIFVINELGEK
jgi:hypothetical protein